jgi:hypothetical protein
MRDADPDEMPVCVICKEPPEQGTELHTCIICRRLFCQQCMVADYGRQFCSTHCRDLFFYGDADGDV